MTPELLIGLLALSLLNYACRTVRWHRSGRDAGAEGRYVPWFWWGIMTIIKSIPERIFMRLSI